MDHTDGTIETPANPIHQLIERWWEDHFPGSAIARDTAAWNVAHAAKEMLKRLLSQEPRLGQNPTADAGMRRGGEDLQRSI
jgi:hypothetical protein